MAISAIEPITRSPRIVQVQRSYRTTRIVRRERRRATAPDKSPPRKVAADEALKLLGIGRYINVLA